MSRLPKPGEVWTLIPGMTFTVVDVYPTAVTYTTATGQVLATTTEQFLKAYTPPEPTVVASRWLIPDGSAIHMSFRNDQPAATHRLDLLSDGEFRVVKL